MLLDSHCDMSVQSMSESDRIKKKLDGRARGWGELYPGFFLSNFAKR